jgi:hypothetical protein
MGTSFFVRGQKLLKSDFVDDFITHIKTMNCTLEMGEIYVL